LEGLRLNWAQIKKQVDWVKLSGLKEKRANSPQTTKRIKREKETLKRKKGTHFTLSRGSLTTAIVRRKCIRANKESSTLGKEGGKKKKETAKGWLVSKEEAKSDQKKRHGENVKFADIAKRGFSYERAERRKVLEMGKGEQRQKPHWGTENLGH